MSIVHIDDQKVASMLASPAFRKSFAFLGQAQAKAAAATKASGATAKKAGCGKCGRKNKANQVDYAEIRRAIGQMPIDQKAKMKQMLGASQVQVEYTNGARKKIRLKF